jgi:hypothetical protein
MNVCVRRKHEAAGAALLNQRIAFPRQGAKQISFCGMASLLVSRYAVGVMSAAQRYQEISVSLKNLRALES